MGIRVHACEVLAEADLHTRAHPSPLTSSFFFALLCAFWLLSVCALTNALFYWSRLALLCARPCMSLWRRIRTVFWFGALLREDAGRDATENDKKSKVRESWWERVNVSLFVGKRDDGGGLYATGAFSSERCACTSTGLWKLPPLSPWSFVSMSSFLLLLFLSRLFFVTCFRTRRKIEKRDCEGH